MSHDERSAALKALTDALRRIYTAAGSPSYGAIERQSRKSLGLNYLPHSTVYSYLNHSRSRPPRREWVLRFWKVMGELAAQQGIDLVGLGPTLEELQRLREAAEAAQRPVRRLTGPAGEEEPLPGDLRRRPGAPDFAETARHREGLAAIRRRVGTEWWTDYSDVVPDWSGAYLSLEPAARLIRVYGTGVVPELLQTEAYAREVLRAGGPFAPSETETARIMELRASRYRFLDRPHPRWLWVVLDESALRRPVGDAGIMREQFAHLITVSARPNVTLQLIPSATEIRTTLSYPFTLLRFPEEDVPDIVYIGHLTSASYLYDLDDVSAYLHVLEGLTLEALTPADTTEYLKRLLRES